MSEKPVARDRRAAFTGLLVGVVVLAVILFTIVQLTNAGHAKDAGEKPAASALR